MSGVRVDEARSEPLAEGLPENLAAKFRKMSHEEATAIITGAAIGWDAAVAAMTYTDGTPVELAVNINPYREAAA
ncbi:hypothetical protein [Arthrobacter sp. ISL-95]|uniref:hypothetical protein n=1 Tax=Arthrobacter sp. ISL-95 TaxID=2819116 RepID=UPI001BEBCE4F|nr:hypothetical protein [Arthrobacter sp. ISL-95]MBT2587916.1 hypothetical protein [Arthrobacter sp. ISL-95]